MKQVKQLQLGDEVALRSDVDPKLHQSAAAPVFDATQNYPAGYHVTYDGYLYRFTSAHAAGAWTGNDVVLDDMTSPDAMLDLTSAGFLRVVSADGTVLWMQNTLSASRNEIAADFSTSAAYSPPALVAYNNTLYRCTTAHPAGAWNATHFTPATVQDVLALMNTEIGGKQDALSDAQLANIAAVPNKASKADATLTERGFSDWIVSVSGDESSLPPHAQIYILEDAATHGWYPVVPTQLSGTEGSSSSTHLEFPEDNNAFGVTVHASRSDTQSPWVFDRDYEGVNGYYNVTIGWSESESGWFLAATYGYEKSGDIKGSASSTELIWQYDWTGAPNAILTATRTALQGYRLGPDEQTNPNRDKPIASTADATLTPIYSDTPTFSEWICVPAEYADDTLSVIKGEPYDAAGTLVRDWSLYGGAVTITGITLPADQEPVSLDFTGYAIATRTRTDILGYQLGSQSDKPLASEAEAEALRTGKMSASATGADILVGGSGGAASSDMATAIDDLFRLKADLDSPTFTGTPVAPTPQDGENSALIATTAFVQGAVPYSLVTKTVANGAVTLDDRACNYVDATSLAALDIEFPAYQEGKMRDFLFAVECGATPPNISYASYITIMAEDADMLVPEEGMNVYSFTEFRPNKFIAHRKTIVNAVVNVPQTGEQLLDAMRQKGISTTEVNTFGQAATALGLSGGSLTVEDLNDAVMG